MFQLEETSRAQGEGTTERKERSRNNPGSRDQEGARDKRENGTGAEEAGTKAREYSVGELTWGGLAINLIGGEV